MPGAVNNHCPALSEEREKQASASNRNGVVGTSGKTAPNAPAATATHPVRNNNQRMPDSCSFDRLALSPMPVAGALT